MSYGFYQAGYSRQDVGTTFVGARVFSVENTATSSITNIITARHAVTTGGAAGIGAGLLFQADDNLGNAESAARVSGILTTATNGSEVGALVFEALTGDALTEGLRIVASAARAPDGTAALPSYSFTTSTNAGWYLAAAGNVGLSIAGANQAEFTADFADFKGTIWLGTAGSAAAPGLALRTDTDTGIFWAATNTLGLSGGAVEGLRMGTVEVVVNEASVDLDFRVEGFTFTNLLICDGGQDAIGFGTPPIASAGHFINVVASAKTPAVGSNGLYVSIGTALAEAASGTHAIMAGVNVAALSLATAGGATTTDAASLRIAGAPSGATGNWSLWVDAGLSRFDDSILVGATAVGSGSPTNLVVVGSGTAPGSSPADSVTFYSADFSAGNTVPSFYCEGTGVLLTAQADSASATRVRMKINGTDVTLLAI